MKILHISCSPHGQSAESYRLSSKIVRHLQANHPGATVVNRDLGNGAVPHIDHPYALAQHAATGHAAGDGSIALSDRLIEELDAADVVVIGTPIHNMGLPSALKAWIDHVVRAGRTFEITPQGKVGVLRDRPVYIAVASGGRFTGERARQPDFLTPYLVFALGMIGLHELTFFTVQGTVAPADVLAATRAETDRALREHFTPAHA